MAEKTKNEGFTAEEKAAMKEHAKELKASASKAENLAYMLEKIEELSEPDRGFARKIHEIVTTVAPHLAAKTWYGMPNYNNEDGKSVLFFQPAEKFKARYATLGFNDTAQLDDGDMWPAAYAIKHIGAAEEKVIAALVKRAAGL